MQGKLCQSCGMPMGDTDELYGTEKNGAKSHDYCRYCYANGAFTADCTMDQMIDFCVKPMVDNSPGMTEAAAREAMKSFFPTLRRWKQA